MGRESLVKAVNASSLAWDENLENPVDRIAALGIATKSNPLGAAIVHAEALDAQSLRKAVLLVARLLIKRHRIARTVAERVTEAALREHMSTRCHSCGGVPFLEGRVAHVCPDCRGTGLHRYSNSERVSMVGHKISTKIYEDALNEIRERFGQAVTRSAAVLSDEAK